jgi:exosortase A
MKRDIEFIASVPGYRAALLSAPVVAALLAAAAIVALHWQTAATIAAIWWRSDTFAHGFVVLPICLWLTWQQRATLAQLPARPWWPGLFFVLGAGALWLVMSAVNVLGLAQFALAFMVQAAIVTVVGTRVALALLFPLALLLFAVPAGEVFVPTLVNWTADFVVVALRATGVPVYREGNHLILASGAWSVVDACSGIRYLIASVMVGIVYAALTYRSLRRRAMFVVASILVPIFANWLRAYLIVMVGHLSNNRLAAGVDHLIYGWVFFGVVMLLLFWVGSFWREAPTEVRATGPVVSVGGSEPAVSAKPQRLFVAALAAIAAAAVWLPLAAIAERGSKAATPAIPSIAGAGGWVPAAAAGASWKPTYAGYAAEVSQTFVKDGREVGLYVAYYRRQGADTELITSSNTLVRMEEWSWKQLAEGSDDVEWMGRTTKVDRASLAGPSFGLEVYRLYWIDGRLTSSEIAAKALLAYSILRGHGDDSAAIFMYTRAEPTASAARVSLRSFASAMSPSIERALGAVR